MTRTNPRPTVRLTKARIQGRTLTHLEYVYLNRALVHHGQPNRDHLSYVCLECGSVGESADQPARDHNANHIDFTCCDPARTVTFRTEAV